MKLFVTIYNDARLLGHFLRHYARAGITEFFIAVAPELEGAVAPFLDAYDITLCRDLDVEDSLLNGTLAVSEMRRRYQTGDEWVVIVDLDEFVEFGGDRTAIIRSAELAGANVVRGVMVDRFSRDGMLAEFEPDSDLSAVYPIKARFIRNVMLGCDHKAVLVKGHLKPAAGKMHHWFDDERAAARTLEISHHKWIPGAVDRLRISHDLVAGAGIGWAIEYRRALDHYDMHGRFAWETFGGVPAAEFRLDPPALCSRCGGAISEDEMLYSRNRFGTNLCRTDQRGGLRINHGRAPRPAEAE